MALERTGSRWAKSFLQMAPQVLMALALFLLCLLPHLATASGKVAAWEVRKGSSTVYLLGSIHALRDSDYPLPSLFEQIAGRSSRIVFELLQEDLNSASTANLIQQLGLYPAGTAIYEEISDATYNVLQAYLTENKLPRNYFDRSRPWLVSGEIDNREIGKAGFKAELGIEQYFNQFAAARQKTVGALETAEFQIRLFANTPIADQEVQLRASLDKRKENVQNLVEIVAHWKNGDIQAIRQLINATDDPVAYQRIFTDRNRNWVPQIEAFLEQSEPTLVVGGVGHFVGPDSVIEMLQQRGHRIEQLPIDAPSIIQIAVNEQDVRLKVKAATTRKLIIYSSTDLGTWEPRVTIDVPTAVTELSLPRGTGVQFYRAALTES